MNFEEILTLISRIAFILCQGCLIAYCIIMFRLVRKRKKRNEEYERDLKTLIVLEGEEYQKALAEFKNKYLIK